jgi:hypothetical protein
MLIDCGFFVALPVSVVLQYTFVPRGNMLHQRNIYVIFQLKGDSKNLLLLFGRRFAQIRKSVYRSHLKVIEFLLKKEAGL